MDTINSAINAIKHQIPRAILEETFNDPDAGLLRSIDDGIYRNVILGRVVLDCNLIGGEEALIYISQSQAERVNDMVSLYDIPDSATQNREVISPLSVTYATSLMPNAGSSLSMGRARHMGASQSSDGCSQSELLKQAKSMIDTMKQLPVLSHTNLKMTARNVLRVTDSSGIFGDFILRCILGNSANMENLQPYSRLNFNELCVLACKAYCHNELVIKLNKQKIAYGQGLGVIKDIVDEYSEANELYLDYLKNVWTTVAFCNDRDTYRRFISLQIPNF